jgi:Na+/proline symporter
MACRSDRDARHAAVVFTVAQVVLRSLLWIAIGLGLLVLMPMQPGASAAARELTFVEGIARYLPEGAVGLMLTGMLAALASTLDTHLNWGASYWTNDIYRGLICRRLLHTEPTGRTLVWVARLSNLLVLAVAMLILTQLDSIQSAWKTSLLLGAGMGLPLVLRWLWWRVTAAAELTAIVVSTVLAPILLASIAAEGLRMLLMTLATTVTTVVVSLCSSAIPGEGVKAFYRRVQPPGFWAPVASACGDDPRQSVQRLKRGLWAAGSAALATFCVLVAVGSWLFHSPAPRWFPWQGPWIVSLLFVAVMLLLRLRPHATAV